MHSTYYCVRRANLPSAYVNTNFIQFIVKVDDTYIQISLGVSYFNKSVYKC